MAGQYRNYLLGMLLAILALNAVDRLAFGLLLQDIKTDLALTDTQLGLLTGIAFALFYSIAGLPLARWADRGNRVNIIALTTALWSAAVALCGMAGSFVQLLLIRVGVAVGEAGCVPPAHSLIAEYYNRDERPRAMAIYMLGAPLSVVIGYFLAGWMNEFYGWRTAIMLLGVPGVAVAGIAWLTLKEPRREQFIRLAPPPQTSWRDVISTLYSLRTFRHLLVCFSLASFFGYGMAQWQPAFFVRAFGLKSGELGTWFAAIYGISGLVGTYLGGEFASRLAARNERVQLRSIAIAYLGFGIISAGMYLSQNLHLSFGLMSISALGVAIAVAPLFATIQTLVPERMRAMAVAILYLFGNLIGMGLGPLAAGVLSDYLRVDYGADSLRYALLALCPGYAWAAWHLWSASRYVAADLRSLSAT